MCVCGAVGGGGGFFLEFSPLKVYQFLILMFLTHNMYKTPKANKKTVCGCVMLLTYHEKLQVFSHCQYIRHIMSSDMIIIKNFIKGI